VAQLDRAAGFEPVGRELESLRAHHMPRVGKSVSLCHGASLAWMPERAHLRRVGNEMQTQHAEIVAAIMGRQRRAV
jgi:hypothetical protein